MLTTAGSLELHSCRAEIDPVSFRIFCDDGVLRADVFSAVVLMNLGRRKLENVDIFSPEDMFRDGSRSN